MNRAFIGRFVGALAVAFGLMLGLFAGSANAQIFQSPGPDSTIQVANSHSSNKVGVTQTPATAQGEVGAAWQCGYWSYGSYAYYTHCGGQWIKIRVEFWYGWNGYTDIWVGPHSTTNLSNDYRLQNRGLITKAYCIQNC